jgi:hypothetical protein
MIEMNTQVLVFVIYVFVIVCMSIVTWVTVRKGEKHTDSLVSLTKLFSIISTDLKVIIVKLEEYERQGERSTDIHKEMIAQSLKSISDRMEKLEKSNLSTLLSLDNDINRLYLHCSKKIERETGTRGI